MAASLADLKAITAEHVDSFDANGRTAIRGANKRTNRQLEKSKDPFDRPSPGLIKRLAAEARNDAKSRHFQNEAGPSDEQRREIMLAKARKYEAMKRGDYSGMTEKELSEVVFDRKWEDHDSDVDESETLPFQDDLLQVEYIDEMGRTRIGSLKDQREAERVRNRRLEPSEDVAEEDTAYAEVLRSNVIHGDQHIYPVYQPDPDKLREKWKATEEESRPKHYDSKTEVRVKGAGAYDFSQDQAERQAQMASLKSQREETEQVRSARPAKRSKADERRAMIEAKRAKLLGVDAVERLREGKRQAEADKLLEGLAKEWKENVP